MLSLAGALLGGIAGWAFAASPMQQNGEEGMQDWLVSSAPASLVHSFEESFVGNLFFWPFEDAGNMVRVCLAGGPHAGGCLLPGLHAAAGAHHYSRSPVEVRHPS